MRYRFAALLLAVSMIPVMGQTTTELLQKGIFAQETAGDLDGAIAIYRQIVGSAPTQRDLAAQAQYRLGQALLQKGDLTNASSEFAKLARDYADYQKLVAALAGQARLRTLSSALGTSPLTSMTFDPARPVNVRGKVAQMTFINPMSMMGVDADSGERYFFLLGAAKELAAQNIARDTFKLGEVVTITGNLGNSQEQVEGRIIAGAATIANESGQVVYRHALPDRSVGIAVAMPQKAAVAEMLAAAERQLEGWKSNLAIAREHYREDHPDVQVLIMRVERTRREMDELKKAMAQLP